MDSWLPAGTTSYELWFPTAQTYVSLDGQAALWRRTGAAAVPVRLENGSWGTDHGWGSAIFVTGGLVKKSGVVADWPGLATKNLYEGRDLKATLDARSLYARIVSSVFQIDPEVVRAKVIDSPKDDRFDAYL